MHRRKQIVSSDISLKAFSYCVCYVIDYVTFFQNQIYGQIFIVLLILQLLIYIVDTKNGDLRSKNPNDTTNNPYNQSALLGPPIWDRTLSFDLTNDFKDFELEYMDLDEFFNVSHNVNL